jgi:acetoin utilization deacetylase AcuC-like enzyme
VHVWSSAHYTFPLPTGHRFPIAKYATLRERVVSAGIVAPERIHDPARAAREDLLRVHTADYVDQFTAGRLDDGAMRRIGFPWSEQLVERSYRAVGGTCEAARAALDAGVAMNLAGGTHHAFADHGEGYCVFNDVAVAIRSLQAEGKIGCAAVVDLDVHQGNGTHAIFAGDDSVFTFSMHGARNYPFHKVPGCVDIELNDGTGRRRVSIGARGNASRRSRPSRRGPRRLSRRRRSARARSARAPRADGRRAGAP